MTARTEHVRAVLANRLRKKHSDPRSGSRDEISSRDAGQAENACYNPPALGGFPIHAAPVPPERIKAQVAQLVEQRTENPRVGGSIPPLGTTKFPIKSMV